ncbi:MAG TPA: signal peptidase I [Rickettsiales bacterium]|nr:signal peptidase I [Rickettsiales bacterium]
MCNKLGQTFKSGETMETSSSKLKQLFVARNAQPDDWKETIRTVAFAIVFALIFRTFAYEPFHIPSGSMKNTLLIGDYLFVSKFSYGYSRFSLPYVMKLLPMHGRLFDSHPKRGDIVVFHPPGNPPLEDQFIKRVIGLPGDRIQMKDSILYINDKPLPKEFVGTWTDKDIVKENEEGSEFRQKEDPELNRYKETMPNGVTYYILNKKEQDRMENTDVYTVPDGHYFMMGDNRDNSRDSRYGFPVSYVPEENIVGRADIILFSWSCGFICPHRLFKLL